MIAIAFVIGMVLGYAVCLHEQHAADVRRKQQARNVIRLDEYRRWTA